jgi:hypothetical protein
MAECEICHHDWDGAFQIVRADGTTHTFDSFACAVRALAPVCPTCGAVVFNLGIVVGEQIFCSMHCAGAGGLTTGFTEN